MLTILIYMSNIFQHTSKGNHLTFFVRCPQGWATCSSNHAGTSLRGPSWPMAHGLFWSFWAGHWPKSSLQCIGRPKFWSWLSTVGHVIWKLDQNQICDFSFIFVGDTIKSQFLLREVHFWLPGMPVRDFFGGLSGYNSCLFAYGQTGSGKTYTVLGCRPQFKGFNGRDSLQLPLNSWDQLRHERDPGLIPRLLVPKSWVFFFRQLLSSSEIFLNWEVSKFVHAGGGRRQATQCFRSELRFRTFKNFLSCLLDPLFGFIECVLCLSIIWDEYITFLYIVNIFGTAWSDQQSRAV